MTKDIEREDLPAFLRSFEDLMGHFDEHFGELGSNDRGDTFLALAEKLLPLMDEFSEFPPPAPNERKSHDGGVDLLTAEARDGRILCIQSKYKIREKAEFDTIISKFNDYEAMNHPRVIEADLFDTEKETQSVEPVRIFAVITSSKIEGIITRYEKSTLTSKSFYDRLRSECRLTLIDGPRILTLIQQLYRKSHLIPANMIINSRHGWISSDSVYIGVVQGKALADLYATHGDALFFENIRDFLGVSSGRVVTTRSTVNQEIIATIKNDPRRMLWRNNGVTLRAIGATPNENGDLTLTKAAIVNGCQTTMCLVHCRPVTDECLVPIKVVVTDDAWDIAKATNNQNPVARVDLDLARYLRPQLVRRVAASLGYAVEMDSESNASAVLNSIYQTKIDYDELRLLYLGLFSRKPNNVFEANYTELRPDVLEKLYDQAESEEQIFTVIFLLLKESRDAIQECEKVFSGPEYAHLFKRFYREDKPRYRSFLSVVAACAAVRDDISSRAISSADETNRMRAFLGKCREIIENKPSIYIIAYRHSFAAVADSLLDVDLEKSEAEIQQVMFRKVSSMSFDGLYKRVLMRVDAESAHTRH